MVRTLLQLGGVEDVAWEHGHERLVVRYAEGVIDPESIRNEVAEGPVTIPS